MRGSRGFSTAAWWLVLLPIEDINLLLFMVLISTGVKMTEVLLAHLVNQFTVLVGQTALVFICMLWIFSIPCEGNLVTAVVITLLQGLCGMSYGNFSYIFQLFAVRVNFCFK